MKIKVFKFEVSNGSKCEYEGDSRESWFRIAQSKLATPEKIENKNDYILFVGRLSKEKGVELLGNTAKLLDKYTFLISLGNVLPPEYKNLILVPNAYFKFSPAASYIFLYKSGTEQKIVGFTSNSSLPIFSIPDDK